MTSEPHKNTCLWDGINPVKEAGEVCSYEHYDAWISWHLEIWPDDEVIRIEEGETMLLPMELQGFYQKTWRDR